MSKFAGPKIVVIGGGTGSYTLLKELKNYAQDITAIVTMADDGGSTGQLRDEYGVLPPGDIRQCLVALSNSTQQMRDLFNYRFGEGSFEGHSFGNVFLTAVEKMTDDFGEAVKLAGKVLNISGKVLPMTLDNTRLVMLDDKKEIAGQYLIGKTRFTGKDRPDFRLEPHAWINPEAKKAILDADMVVIAPSNFYASLVPAIIVDGASEALQKTNAKVVQVINLVTKPGQTDGWKVTDYVAEFEHFAGQGVVDFALYNTDEPTEDMLKQYAADGEFPVGYNEVDLRKATYTVVGKNLVSKDIPVISPNDKLERTLIRHDSSAVAKQLMRIYFS
jgi:uncharacterized cofD-like protein